MKYCLIFIIKFYWMFIPESKRKRCLFRQTCSKKVYDVTMKEGLIKGLLTLYKRHKQCRYGYSFYINDSIINMLLVDGTILNEDEINLILLKDFKSEFSSISS